MPWLQLSPLVLFPGFYWAVVSFSISFSLTHFLTNQNLFSSSSLLPVPTANPTRSQCLAVLLASSLVSVSLVQGWCLVFSCWGLGDCRGGAAGGLFVWGFLLLLFILVWLIGAGFVRLVLVFVTAC